MFGQNISEPKIHDHDGSMLDVIDIFSTFQGEGPYAGMPATFIRLAGCHLRCMFCDTDFITERHKVSLNVITDIVLLNHHNKLVVITGGEPLRQNIVPLCEAFHVVDYTVQIETAGHFWWNYVSEVAEIVVSPKTPIVHPKISAHARAWKYIITADGDIDEEDGLPNSSTQPFTRPQRLARPPIHTAPDTVYIQPCDHGDENRNKYALEKSKQICLKHGYRLSLQLHKILGVP